MKKLLILTLILTNIIYNAPMAFAKHPQGNYVEKEYYDNGNLRLYVKFRDDLIVRKKAYYRNGQVKLDYVYKNGEVLRKLNYHENGRKASVWTRKSGVTKFYYPDGRLRVVVDDAMPGN